jgi:hypothetical protein
MVTRDESQDVRLAQPILQHEEALQPVATITIKGVEQITEDAEVTLLCVVQRFLESLKQVAAQRLSRGGGGATLAIDA